MSKKKIIADLLFGVQIACTFIFGGVQFWNLLKTTQGVSVSWYAFWEMFLALNLWLAYRSHKAEPSRVTSQTLAAYGLWVVVVGADIGAMLWRDASTWDMRDNVTAALATSGILATIMVGRQQKLGVSDPMIKGWLALFFKAVPQLVLAWKITADGNGGLAGPTLLVGHVTVLTRLGQLRFAIKEAGWDRNRKGSALSEVGNELSWIVVTAMWLYVDDKLYETAVIVTASLMMISAVDYVRRTWKQETRPVVATWILMITMISLTFWMYWSSPDKTLTGNISVVTGFVNTLMILSGVIATNIRYKTLSVAFNPVQKSCLAAGAVVALLWAVTKQPLAMYSLIQLIGLAAYAATAQRLWRAEKSTEPLIFWFCTLGANLCAIYPALVKHDVFAGIYLARVLPTTTGMIYLIWRIKRRMKVGA